MKRSLQAVLRLAVSALALWLTLRGKSLPAIWRAALAADYRYLLPCVAALLVIYLVRVLRWGLLLDPAAGVSFARLNAASAVGLMAQLILPFRLGELARPYLVADGTRLRVSQAVSSVVVERVADGVFTALLFVAALAMAPPGTPGLQPLRAVGAAAFLGFASVAAFLALARRHRDRAASLVRRLAAPVSRRAAVHLSEMVDAFFHGLQHRPTRGRAVLFVALTAAYWGLTAACMQLLARGFGFDLSAVASCIVLGIVVLGIMLPSAPGMVGTFQAAVVLGLSLFEARAAVATRGTAFANVLWLTQLVVQVSIGLYFLFSRHIRFRGLLRTAPVARTGGEEPPERPMKTEEASYAARLLDIESVWWKRALDVQRPYRSHLRRLRLGFVLEVGCGIGRNLAALGPGAGVGVDHNPNAVAVARRRGLIAFTPGDFLESAHGQPGRFDSLLVSHVLEHMEPPEALELLGRYLGFVRAGGRVVIITPQEAGFRSDPTHVAFIDSAQVGRIVRGAGLEPMAHYSFPFPRLVGRYFKYNEFVTIARKVEGLPREPRPDDEPERPRG